MMPSLGQLLEMVGRSIKSPREGAAEILAYGVPREALPLIVGLVVILSAVLAEVTALVGYAAGAGPMTGILGVPVGMAAVQLVVLLITVAGVYGVGRALGGTGSLEETALIISWLQFIMVCIQVIQTVVLIVLPPLGAMVGLAAVVLFLWLLTNFVAALHGFRSLGQVFVMILVTAFSIAFLLSLILALFGVGVQMPAGDI